MASKEDLSFGFNTKFFEEGMKLQVGDKVIVRIELRVDRDMEFVHMKDMRASALEPVNTPLQF